MSRDDDVSPKESERGCYSLGMPIRPRVASLAVALLLGAGSASAQSVAMDGVRGEFADVKKSVMTAATKAPESIYGYQPTPDVFTLRKQLLHIADASYSICAGFKATPGQRPKVNADAPLPKSEVLATLTAAFAYCDEAMAAATDSTLGEVVTSASGAKRPKSYYASHLLSHTGLHYGNIVTYMRLNKLSPGDQERRPRRGRAACPTRPLSIAARSETAPYLFMPAARRPPCRARR